MDYGRIIFTNKPNPNRPIEEKYIAEVNSLNESFIDKDDAIFIW